jgi:hypothetical protein
MCRYLQEHFVKEMQVGSPQIGTFAGKEEAKKDVNKGHVRG